MPTPNKYDLAVLAQLQQGGCICETLQECELRDEYGEIHTGLKVTHGMIERLRSAQLIQWVDKGQPWIDYFVATKN